MAGYLRRAKTNTMAKSIHHRSEYQQRTLLENEAGADPLLLFHRWLNDAESDGLPEHNAMSLATSGPHGPSCRIVLLRSFDEAGFVFYTNYNSRKALQVEQDARAALLFFWPQHERQVRIEGGVDRVAASDSDVYFGSRPRGSRIGAWASDQSARIGDRQALDEKYGRWQERFLDDEIPRPEHWGGYRVQPLRIEFWQGRDDRLHDRILFTREERGGWSRARLQP